MSIFIGKKTSSLDKPNKNNYIDLMIEHFMTVGDGVVENHYEEGVI